MGDLSQRFAAQVNFACAWLDQAQIFIEIMPKNSLDI